MGGGHPGLAAIAERSEVSPINRRIVLTARAFAVLEHRSMPGQTGACARLHDLVLSRPHCHLNLSLDRKFPCLPARKRRLRIFASSVRMTRHSYKARIRVLKRQVPIPRAERNGHPSKEQVPGASGSR
jgi:hypothetical protein